MSQPPEQNTGTLPSIFSGSEPQETPDVLLTKFLRSTEIVANPGGPPPQQALKTILNDPRWSRRMLEDWFKKGPISKQPIITLTPDPEFRALYLVLLAKLEDGGKEKSGLGVKEVPERKEPKTAKEKQDWEDELGGRIDTWKNEHGIR